MTFAPRRWNTGIVMAFVTLVASPATSNADDGIEVLGPLEGSFGDLSSSDIADVVAGDYHALLLTEDGAVRAAGWNGPYDLDTGAPCGQCDPPDGMSGIQTVAVGVRHSMALRFDGSVVCWGCDDTACDVPPEFADRGSNDPPADPPMAIAAGDGFCLVLLESGTIACWGETDQNQVCEIPEEAQDPANPAVGILASGTACVAILQDNTFVRWGDEIYGPLDGLPDGAVIADASLSPLLGQFDPNRPSLAFLLADGRYIDGGGIITFEPDNPCISISPGPTTLLLLADGRWIPRFSIPSGQLPLPGDMGFPNPPVSIVTGGRNYLITVPLPADCDEDGVPDDEQIAADPTLDCDGDGRLDACRPGSHWFEGGVIAAEGDDLDLSDLPFSEAPVTISVEATGDLEAANEFLLFDWNGGTFATAFGKNGPGEPCEAATNTFGIAPRIWNDADENGERILTVSPSFPVDPAACEESNFAITFAIEATAPSHDCNENGIDDDCEIAAGLALDVDGDRSPDECQPDCDRDGQPDAWTIFEGLVPDCNANGIPDSCDILSGEVVDADGNGIPDGCELDCRDDGDLNGDGCVGPADLGLLLSLWGTSNPVCGDLDGDGDVRAADLGILLSNWDCR